MNKKLIRIYTVKVYLNKKNIMIKKFTIFLFFLISLNNNLYGLENKIELKIDNEIVTSLDIKKEARYLKALNPKINELEEKKIYQISRNSIIKEKIKKNELLKNLKEIQIEQEIVDKFIENIFNSIGISSKDSFINYLRKNNLNLKDVENKISLEISWNRLIYSKFVSKLKINENDIKKKLLLDKNKISRVYFLQEILYEVDNKSDAEKKYKIIRDSINNNGFEKTALLFSESDSSSSGGLIGWVDEASLSPVILENIKNLDVGAYTNPIVIPGGFLILKIKELKTQKKEINLDEELEKIIRAKTNEQLSQYSQVFYNKIKKDLKINEY